MLRIHGGGREWDDDLMTLRLLLCFRILTARGDARVKKVSLVEEICALTFFLLHLVHFCLEIRLNCHREGLGDQLQFCCLSQHINYIGERGRRRKEKGFLAFNPAIRINQHFNGKAGLTPSWVVSQQDMERRTHKEKFFIRKVICGGWKVEAILDCSIKSL